MQLPRVDGQLDLHVALHPGLLYCGATSEQPPEREAPVHKCFVSLAYTIFLMFHWLPPVTRPTWVPVWRTYTGAWTLGRVIHWGHYFNTETLLLSVGPHEVLTSFCTTCQTTAHPSSHKKGLLVNNLSFITLLSCFLNLVNIPFCPPNLFFEMLFKGEWKMRKVRMFPK